MDKNTISDNFIIDSMRKEADHIPDNIKIEKTCPFCKARSRDIALIQEDEYFLVNKVSYCYCTICGIETPKFSAVVSRKVANKKAINFWNTRPQED